MNIDFFGSSLVSSYWNGAATYYRGLLRALAGLGHQITFYEPDAFERQAHRDMPDPDWARIIVYPATPTGWQQALAVARRNADLLVKASGVGVFDAELDAAIPDARRNGVMSVYWDVDAPATLDAIESDPKHRLRHLIPRYDAVLTYGGHAPVVESYRRWGARACVPVYNALDPDTHYPVAPEEAFRCDLSFLGNRLPDREARVEEFFLNPAARSATRTFLLGGAGWEGKAIPPNVTIHGHVGTSDHNAFYCSALATLNINRESMARYGFSPPTRIFEAAGASACVISDAWEGIDLFLEPGEEILVAKDGEAVADLLKGLTVRGAREIGCKARLRMLAEHTYAHRAIQVTRFLDPMVRHREAVT
jgi:spore maturation protein CgeB